MNRNQTNASAKAKSTEHFNELLSEPGNYEQRPTSDAYREGWERIFGTDNKDDDSCDSAST